jgi:ElaA protein
VRRVDETTRIGEVIVWRLLPYDQLTVNDLYAICAARQSVFVVEQNCVYLDADGYDSQAYHLLGIAENLGSAENNTLAAYARLFPVGTKYQDAASIGRVLTTLPFRGQGVGQELMRQALVHCSNLFPNAPIRLSAQHYLLDFYESFGFAACSEIYDEDGIPHIEMMRC